MSFTTKKIVYASLSLGLAISFASPKTVFPGTITINQDGSISAPVIPSVLGQTTTPELEAIEDKMQAEEQEILRAYQAGELTREQVREQKLALVAKYKAEIQAAKQPIINQVKEEAKEEKALMVAEIKEQAKTEKVEAIERFTTQSKILKINSSSDSGKLMLQTIGEDGEVSNLAEEDEIILPSQEQNQKMISTKIMAKAQNRYLITNGVAAKVGTPISYNLETNEMIISTPNGDKVVSVLPDQALAKAQAVANLIVDQAATDDTSELGDEEETATPSGEEEAASPSADETENIEETAINLVTYQDSPAYEISGKTQKKLLGVVPIKINKTVYVSAVSGNILDQTAATAFDKLLDLISR